MRSHKHHIYVYPFFERGLDVTNDICYTRYKIQRYKIYSYKVSPRFDQVYVTTQIMTE